MKVQIVIDKERDEEVIIYCKEYSDEIAEIKKTFEIMAREPQYLYVYKQETEYYLKLTDILFFQSQGREIYAHTEEDIYLVKQKLYELENELQQSFARVSKSAIVNVIKVYAINRGLTYWTLEFRESYKKISVSRSYFKSFKYHLEERRKVYGKK